jgi:uncharacterized protein (TIGR02302 family)
LSATPPDSAPPANPGPTDLRLAQAIKRARLAIAWEHAWPHLARFMTVIGAFLAVSWAGAWLVLPLWARLAGLAGLALAALAALVPLVRLQWPTHADALRRLDSKSALAHRPATALTDTMRSQDPVTHALWQAERERLLRLLTRLRVGRPEPRLPRHDPLALRALVVVALAATFFAADGERTARIAAAFDWGNVLAPANVRLDAWVTPPAYTGRPPVILSAAGRDAGADSPVLSVPAGSVLVVRASGARLDVSVSGGLTEAEPTQEAAPDGAPNGSDAAGAEERRFTISGDGMAEVRAPARQPPWRFAAVTDQPPRIALAKEPERRARGGLELSYKIEDDYGVTEAKARFKAIAEMPTDAATQPESSDATRPLFEPPDFNLTLPNARTRNGVGQTVKDLSDSPYAGAEVELTLAARDEAGNEGTSEPFTLRLPQRVFTKPLARALIEQRRLLALDARASESVATALDALLIAPEIFAPEAGQYLGLRSVAAELSHAGNDDALRGVVGSLWALALTIEDGNITDVEKELRAAQDALREALERGASDEEIRQLTDRLRAALDNYMRQLAEQLRNNPQQLARPLDPNSRVMRQQDLDNMISRMEQLSRSGDKEAARQLLEQLQQMLENLQMAQPAPGDGANDMEQALNELGDMIRKQQQLRDRTFNESQDARRDRRNGERRDRNAMQGLQQDQQALRDRLRQLQEEMARRGMGQRPGQREQGGEGQQGREGRGGDQGDQGAGNALGEADSEMGNAEGRLGEGNAGGAADAQGRALEALRRGAQSLADAMQQQMGEGGGEGDGPRDRLGRQGRNGERTDPLGRPLRGREFGDDQSVKIPGEIDVQRVRRILEELRRRLSDPARPQIELDYLERLLKDY